MSQDSQGNANLKPLVDKLQRQGGLSASDIDAILALPHRIYRARSGEHLVRQGDRPDRCSLLLSGWASRQRLTGDGRRQVLALHVAGDFVDLQNAMLEIAHDDVQAIGACEVALIPKEAIVDLAFARPAIGRLLWVDTLIDASIAREWTLNVGQRDARTRILHLLCELYERQEAAGLSANGEFEVPFSQELLADATGLTAVHVNRVLQALRGGDLIEREQRSIKIVDWDAMRSEGDFSATYMMTGDAEACRGEA